MTDQSGARRNIAVLTTAQALGGSSAPIVMSLGGLVGQQLSGNPAWVTLPVSLFGVGLALGTLPAALLMRAWGRRNAYVFAAAVGVAAGLIAAFGIFLTSFAIFCIGSFTAGLYGSYIQSYRFAAADAAEGALKARAISWVMVGGLIAAVVGPQLVIWTRDAVTQTPYAGSFLSQAALALLSVPVLLMLRASASGGEAASENSGRSLLQILAMPRYLLAVATGVASYGLMAFVMTAAPIAMVGHGLSVDDAALGIQWHLLAMFGPSFVTGRLIARFGKERVSAAGLVLIALSGIVALAGPGLLSFWFSLALLGIGLNFSFIGATAMVTECHTSGERAKAQGFNDFMVFGVTAVVSFLAGSVLHSWGWETINWLLFPAVAVILVPLLLQAGRGGAR